MNKDLKQRQKNLEDILLKETHITWKERLINISYNTKRNLKTIIPIGLTLGFAGLAYLGFSELSHHLDLTSSYTQAYDFIIELKDSLADIVEKGINIEVDPNMIEKPAGLIELGAQNIYAEEANELLQGINQNKQLFAEGADIKPALEYLNSVKSELRELSESQKERNLVCLGVGGTCFGLISLLSSIVIGVEEGFFDWESYYADKKEKRKDIKGNIKILRKRLKNNPNAEKIYDFFDAAVDAGVELSDNIFKVRNLCALGETNTKEVSPLIQAMSFQSKKYFDKLSHWSIEWTFGAFKNQLKKEKKRSNIFLHLIKNGWKYDDISEIFGKIDEYKTEPKSVFLEKLGSGNYEKSFFSDVLAFYRYSCFKAQKRLSMMKYFFKKNNKNLISQFESNCFDRWDNYLLKYIEKLDEIPNIGVKGQVKTIAKLNNLHQYLNDIIHNSSSYRDKFDFKEIIYKPRMSKKKKQAFLEKESAIQVLDFLERHPDIPKEKTLKSLCEYFVLTNGKEYQSDWIRKDIHFQGNLDKKGERKFQEELKIKIDLARFDAFNQKIDDLFFMPIEDILEEKIDRGKTKFNEGLTNVLRGYRRLESDVQTLLKELIKVYLENPNSVRDYLSNLEGNKKLEEKIDKEILCSWKKGFTKSYESEEGKVTFYDSKDVIESLQMGIFVNPGSCLNIRCGHFSNSAITNTIDDNKKIIYAVDKDGKKIGRTLAILTEKGIAVCNRKNNGNISKEWMDYFISYAKQVDVPLFILTNYDEAEENELEKRGIKKQKEVKIKMHKAVCSDWYDDFRWGDCHIEEEGRELNFNAYIIK